MFEVFLGFEIVTTKHGFSENLAAKADFDAQNVVQGLFKDQRQIFLFSAVFIF